METGRRTRKVSTPTKAEAETITTERKKPLRLRESGHAVGVPPQPGSLVSRIYLYDVCISLKRGL